MEKQNTIDVQKIKDFMEENHLTKIQFCKECRIGRETLEKILKDCYESKILAIYKISKFMKCPIKDLFYE